MSRRVLVSAFAPTRFSMTVPFLAVVVLSAVGGGWLRLTALDRRPMHLDEAIHTIKFETLWTTGEYVYDPDEYHGPTLYYLTLPIVWLSGARDYGETTETMFRLVPALFGIGAILLVLLFADGIGRAAAAWAAVWTAVSPALVYYSRDYIQETLLAFFTVGMLGCLWRYVRSRRTVWAILAGLSAGLMHATKETCVIAFGCAVLALAANTLWHWGGRRFGRAVRPYLQAKTVVPAVLVAAFVSVLLYSALFRHASGPLDALRTYETYFDRAGGHGTHDHPWHYYLHILLFWRADAPGSPVWSEGLIVGLALIGMGLAISGRGVRGSYVPLLRFLTLYTLLMTLAYTLIPYKTPWCLLQFLQPMALMAGVGAAGLVEIVRVGGGGARAQSQPGAAVLHTTAGGGCATAHSRGRLCYIAARAGVAVLLVIGCWFLVLESRRATGRFVTDYRNPYAYADTLRGAVELGAYVEKLAAVAPDGRGMLVQVVAPAQDYWPLPWYLRRLSNVGYWESVPEELPGPVVVVRADRLERLPAVIRAGYQINSYGIRTDVVLAVCVERGLYEGFVERLGTEGRRDGVLGGGQ